MTLLKVNTVSKRIVCQYVSLFVSAYADIINGKSFNIPLISLDLQEILAGVDRSCFKVASEKYSANALGSVDDAIAILNNRNLDRKYACSMMLEEIPEISLDDLILMQEKADNFDGFMWGVCISTAEKSSKKGRKGIKNYQKFLNEVLGSIKLAKVIVC